MSRTPRRRISPRTVRRYRAIKKFVRRALGSSSQPKSTSKVSIDDDDADNRETALNKMLNKNNTSRLNTIEENEQPRRRNHTGSRTLPADLSVYSSHSFTAPRHYTHNLVAGYTDVKRHRHRKKRECFETNDGLSKINNNKEQRCGNHKNYRNKYIRPQLDQDFIADIIRRQYRPVKLLGRRESDFSQFSAPVCRDQEFSVRETLEEGSDLCSCCHEEHRQKRVNDFYNDTAMYDVIPVKEKSSPKSRRKFEEDNTLIHDKYPEVPPSPRTQRPRLNLQAQCLTEDNEVGIHHAKHLKYMKKLPPKYWRQTQENISNISSEVFIPTKNSKHIQNIQNLNNPKTYNEECVNTMSSLQYPILANEKALINNDTTLNTQITDGSADKTDKTLSEIKDILQIVLLEIKKESSQSEKFNISPQSDTLQNTIETQQQIKSNSFNNSNSFGYCGLPPFMQPYPNSCCYPMLPVCPINCMQNGFVLPSSSFTCTTCANNSKDQTCGNNDFKTKTNIAEDTSNETQKLIKEIHNLISQHPNSIKKKAFHNDIKQPLNNINAETKTLTSKSVSGYSKVSKHDAKVGTMKKKCHSKSCEAIGFRDDTDTRYATNISYSDTVLEKDISEEITTESVSESEYSSDITVMDKKKENKFTNILRSIGIMKRNKTGRIEEISESDSRVDIEKLKERSTIHSHPTSPYHQHIINYNVHGQEYFHPPVVPRNTHQYGYCSSSPHYNPRPCCSPTYLDNKTGRQFRDNEVSTHCTSPQHTTAPPHGNYYDPRYLNVPPQVPVCLKEIEVKSIGTQSVRKLSLLQKLTNKMQVPVEQARQTSPNQSSTRTSSKIKSPKGKPETTLFDWKKIHEKAMQKTTDPLKYSFRTQKQLADGDNTMRNAMLKKLFYKRNPFSPRNLLVRTLLGKDKSSFGEPPKMYKPKMFL